MMRTAPLRWTLASSLIAGSLAVGAAAQPDDGLSSAETRLLGRWQFQTTQHVHSGDECQVTGQMLVMPDESGSGLVCQFEALHSCKTLGDSTSTQHCTVNVVNNAIVIESAVIEFKSWSARYCPDNFDLRVETPARLVGRLRSCGPSPQVAFTRIEEPIA